MHSIILTVHNKEWLIGQVIGGILQNTVDNYELIVVLDGCTDQSEQVVQKSLENSEISYRILFANNVYETRANNLGLQEANGDKVIIVQDDMIIQEYEWNRRMQRPFDAFDDVFAVTSRTAHNWEFNSNSKHLNMKENLNDCWCDICNHTDHANSSNIPRDIFAVRASVNRGPLMIDHHDLRTLNYFDENFAPQDMDDHDLMYRMHKTMDKVCGCYWIHYESRDEWGGTRTSGTTAPWMYEANHKNTKLFYERHSDLIHMNYEGENRELPQ